MDKETQTIISEQQMLKEVTNHEGWKIVRRIISEKILALQNAFDIETATPTTMLRDLQARKKATEILFDFLREIEGARDVVEENPVVKSFIKVLD